MKKKWWLGAAVLLIILLIIQFAPMLSLKTRSMISSQSEHFVFYYEPKDEAAIADLQEAMEASVTLIHSKLPITHEDKTEIYVYPDQAHFHQKKYGAIVRLLRLDWYVGDNVGERVLLVSPLEPGSHHTYESILETASHEYIHALVYRINKDAPLWLDEGMALYLSNGYPFGSIEHYTYIPTLKDIGTSNPIKFSNTNGYSFAHTYIEFLEKEYGWEQVIAYLIDSNQAQTIFDATEEELYIGWMNYLEREYP